jgi:phage RecT family recombinase
MVRAEFVKLLLAQNKSQIETALTGAPSSVHFSKVAVALKTAIDLTPKILDCDAESLRMSILRCAQLQLSPAPALQHFHLIPFKGKVQAVIGYRGLIELAMRSGELVDLQAKVVYKDERDANKPWLDPTTGYPNHREDPFSEGADEEIIGAYAIALVKGRERPVVMTLSRRQIEKRRMAGGAGGDRPAWHNWYPEQCRKTALRSLLTSGLIPLGERAGRIRDALFEEEEEEVKIVEATPVPDEPVDDLGRPLEIPFDDPPQDTVETAQEELGKAIDEASLLLGEVKEYSKEAYGKAPDDLELGEVRALIQDVKQGRVGKKAKRK